MLSGSKQKKNQLIVSFLMNLTDVYKSDFQIYDAADEHVFRLSAKTNPQIISKCEIISSLRE